MNGLVQIVYLNFSRKILVKSGWNVLFTRVYCGVNHNNESLFYCEFSIKRRVLLQNDWIEPKG